MTQEEQIDTVARTIWGEARGEGEAGMRAVASVIANRAAIAAKWLRSHPKRDRHPLFGDGTSAGAATANPGVRYKQFSCWNADDPNLPKLKAVTETDRDFRTALAVATAAAAGDLPDPTDGATHYYDPRVCTPVWAEGATETVVIGNHRFFKNVK